MAEDCKGNIFIAMLQVSGLYIYPIKSMRGIAVDKATVTDRGFEHDRRWMLADENNLFISQREVAELALMQVDIVEEGLKVTYAVKDSSIIIPFQPQTRELVDFTIWDDTCAGQYVSAGADQWFSDMLNINCRLVYMPVDSRRIVDQRYAPGDHIVSFADGYPFLLIGQASLDDLNSKLAQPVPMNRFRPSIVFTGGEPYAEDMVDSLMIGDVLFHGVKLCARCNIPGIDQDTAISYKEPIKTLAHYRFKNNKIMFGQNLIHSGSGQIAVGDKINILTQHNEERFIV